MKPISLSPQSEKQIDALDQLYRQSKDGRLRQRAQIILLAAEQGMRAPQIAEIVRLNDVDMSTSSGLHGSRNGYSGER